ncbi:MAG: hypothetical protein KMY54_07430 [Erysipelothrix sp.]|jgi:hypothetical protein|nr:hypothetical protein [Erysipelothrix sp.]
MNKRAIGVGVLFAIITLVIVYFALFLLRDISAEGAFLIIIVFIMLPMQIGSIAYLTVVIESIRPKVDIKSEE